MSLEEAFIAQGPRLSVTFLTSTIFLIQSSLFFLTMPSYSLILEATDVIECLCECVTVLSVLATPLSTPVPPFVKSPWLVVFVQSTNSNPPGPTSSVSLLAREKLIFEQCISLHIRPVYYKNRLASLD